MESDRLPARLEVSGFIRRAEALGGSAMVLRKGEPDAGTILLIFLDKQGFGTLYERLPQPDGPRKWVCVRSETAETRDSFAQYLSRRTAQDPDVWVIELIVAQDERSVLNLI